MLQGFLYSKALLHHCMGPACAGACVCFPPGGRLSEAALGAAHTLPLTGVSCSVGSAAGTGVKGDFSSNWMKRCGEVVQVSAVSRLQLIIIVMVISEQEIEEAGF